MDSKKDLEYFNNFKYEVIIKKKNNEFILFISELNIVKKDASLERAYQKIETAKEEYFKSMIESDLSEKIQFPSNLKNKKRFGGGIVNFIIKLVIAIFIGVIGISFIFGRVESLVSNSVISFSRALSIERIKGESADFLNRISDIPDAKIEATRQKIRKTVKKYKPIIDEFKMLLKESPEDNSEQINFSEKNEN